RRRHTISKRDWSSDVCSSDLLLTALCSAASTAVFSAGKHFAQPHRVRPGKSLAFHMKRALTDRSVDVVEQFRRAVHEIGARAARSEERRVGRSVEHGGWRAI